MAREHGTTPTEPPQTLAELAKEWKAGRGPDFHVFDNSPPAFSLGDRITMVEGPYAGRHGSVTLTHENKLVAVLVGLKPGHVRVALDADDEGVGWSGFVKSSQLTQRYKKGIL